MIVVDLGNKNVTLFQLHRHVKSREGAVATILATRFYFPNPAMKNIPDLLEN